MTSLQDSFSSISQLADSVALPDRQASDAADDKEVALRLGLERVRLMLVAEEDGERIREVWTSLKRDDVEDEDLKRRVQETQEMVDRVPPPTITITTTDS
jgi:hypothetical protein